MNPIVTALAKGIKQSGIKSSKISIPSDIPFDPKTVKDLGIDFFHTMRGRAIPFGTGLKLGNPALRVMPIIGDMMTIGGNHLVHAGRRNMELLVICVNNFIYRKVAGKSAPVKRASLSTFSPYSTFEQPFNGPHLANSCGAIYTARWTALHTDELAASISEALGKPGFSFIEVLSPGPDYYTSIREVDSKLLEFYHKNSVVKNGEDPKNAEISSEEKIVVGQFTYKKRPTFIDTYNEQLSKILGDKFIPHGKTNT
jgi:2-oxoglutarate ferredoxin oxidoreductase subunit beta